MRSESARLQPFTGQRQGGKSREEPGRARECVSKYGKKREKRVVGTYQVESAAHALLSLGSALLDKGGSGSSGQGSYIKLISIQNGVNRDSRCGGKSYRQCSRGQ